MRWTAIDMEVGPASVSHTSDVDQAREWLEHAYLPLEVHPIGSDPFELHMNAVQLQRMTAGYIRFGGEVMVRAPDVRAYHVDIPLSGQATNTWDDGQQQIATTSESAGISTPGMPVDMTWSTGCGQVCLMIPAQEMRQQLEMMLDRPVLAPVEFERSLDLNTTSSASWLQLVTILGREADRPEGLFSHPLAVQTLQNLLIQGLLLMQPHNYTNALRKDEVLAPPRAVRRAIELMRAHPQTSWTTEKLAQEVGVSARALQKGFASSNEPPPITYLRHLRLHRAHSVLREADPQCVTVTAVASSLGFLHFGRFAQQYCQIFGELPSTTLRSGNGGAHTKDL
jgi:AraC-like DNA-binding protein